MDEATQAADLLRKARTIVVSTGAGMSAEAGVPTFRDAESGLWGNVRPEDVATPEAFARDPQMVWDWYRWRRQKLAEIAPHEGHHVLARWSGRGAELTIVTQNVDGLHHRAGSSNVLELHGRLDRTLCTQCPYEIIGLDDLGPLPKCPDCGALLRPGVVWFGEMLPEDALTAAAERSAACDVFMLIGTSGVVYPAAGLAAEAQRGGAQVIEINPEDTPLSALATIPLRSACGPALAAIEAAWSTSA